MIALVFASLIGCAPQDATVKGDWFVWLSASSSATLAEKSLDVSASTRFSCGGPEWNSETCNWDEYYIGPKNGYADNDNHIGGSCEREEGSVEGICDGDYINCESNEDLDGDGDMDADDAMLGFAEECADIRNADFQPWLAEDAYHGLTGKTEPWRSEGIINSEGDLQLTIHVDLGTHCPEDAQGNKICGEQQDFRFHFTIDPAFNPVECVTEEVAAEVQEACDNGDEESCDEVANAKAIIVDADGSNWVDEWSEDEDGYSIYYLNAGSYQVNPNDSETWWYLNNELLSGWGFSKFAAEEFYSHAPSYGNYDEDGNGQAFLGIADHETPDLDEYARAIEDLCEQVYGWDCAYMHTDDDGDGASEAEGDCDDHSTEVTADDCPERVTEDEPLSWQDEMVVMAGAAKGGEAKFAHKIEDNSWRPIDETVTGLDGWMEVHSSWVRIKNGSKIKEGGKVEGDYQIFYDGAESGSRLLVNGTFKINDLREDQWGYEVLEDAKRDENDTPYCGGE